MRLPTGTQLGHYEVLAPLGAGGMGEIYRARDAALDREVAIKVLPENLSLDPDAFARFEREAKAVAALSHPNILAIHEFGISQGVAYAVTELLEGDTLRERLDAGPLLEAQAVEYGLQIARGLSAAHERGVIHRDLKPENIFVTNAGHLKILDFGIAKRVDIEAGAARAEAGYTEPGMVVGTAGYMSPEQVRAAKVDQRSDIFSFGAILYEMLSGRRAFYRASAADTMTAILRDEPTDPGEFGRIVSGPRRPRHAPLPREESEPPVRVGQGHRLRAVGGLARSRERASSAVRHFRGRSALGGSGPAAPAVGHSENCDRAGAARWGGRWCPSPAPREAPGRRRPPRAGGPPGGPPVRESRRARGRVLRRRHRRRGARKADPPSRAPGDRARQLDALPQDFEDAAGDCQGARRDLPPDGPGPVGQVGRQNRVHVAPELVEVSGSQAPASKWQQPFEAPLTNVFQVQADIAARVAQELGVVLRPSEAQRLQERPTKDLAAYDEFLRGEQVSRGMSVQDPPSLRQALTFYERAVALDAGFAQAWARVARADAMLYGNSTPSPALSEAARRAAERAIELAPEHPDGYIAMGQFERIVAKDADRALEQFARARKIAPGSADLLSAIAVADVAKGHWDAALATLQEAQRFDPRSVSVLRRLGDAYFWLRRYAPARETFDRALVLAPTHLGLIETKAMTFLGQGDLTGARAVLAAAPREVAPSALVAYVAAYWDVVWLLDDKQQDLLVGLAPSAFDGDQATWGLCLAQAYGLRGDTAKARATAGEAKKAIDEQLKSAPEDAQRRVGLGLALAYMGDTAGGIREAQTGVAMLPIAKDGFTGPFLQHQLARIYVLAGEPEKAIDQLEPLLKIPYILSPGWLRIDPNFAPLRENPRFQKLVAGV